ncbi:11653_t:CDS:2 [Racocetra persica]|uniref:11653_t:CDS:1 n=1 Tax=Racocetra persica TaxID=160502 RepID=A0ACA9LF21_9GLOM|nr:11653_t:CDS:2 [Racocetra persica]
MSTPNSVDCVNEDEKLISESCPSPALSVSTTASTNDGHRRKKKKKYRSVESRFMQHHLLKPTISKKPSITGINRLSIRSGGSVINRTSLTSLNKTRTSLNKAKSQDKNSNKIIGNETQVSQQPLISLDDELTMLNSRLTQWCFLNAKADHAFECQKRSAETRLLDAWKLLVKKQDELSNAIRKFTLEEDISRLDTTLSFQANLILQISKHLEHFKTRYVTFASSLASTATAMPISNILTDKLDQLSGEIDICSNATADLLKKWEETSLVHDVASSMQKLCINLKEEVQELNECNTLLREISDAEIVETSLRIEKIENMSNSDLKWAKVNQ